MPDIDYDPVVSPEEEEQRKRREGDYPPAVAPPVVIPKAEVSGVDAPPPALSVPGGEMQPVPSIGGAPQAKIPLVDNSRPKWEDYAPVQKHGIGRVGQVLGEMFLGTQSKAENRAEHAYKNATAEYEAPNKEAQQQAQTQELNASTEEKKAHAHAELNPVPKEGLTPEEKFMTDALHGDSGRPRNDASGKPYTYLSAHAAWKQAEQDTKPDKGRQTRDVTRVIGGVPHTVMVDAQTGEDIKDEGQTKIPGESPKEKRSAAESVQVEREARAHVAKAEQDYNNARSTVAMQRELIKEAKSGNKEAVRMVPLEGALEITTSQGVHRINRTEVEQYGSAGNLFDKIKGAIGSGVSGKSIPDSVLKDMDAMTSELQKNAHERYKHEYNYNKSVVEGYGGEGFDKRVPMVQPEPEAQPFKVPAGAPAPPKEDGHKLKANGQVVAISQGGQWVAPQ